MKTEVICNLCHERIKRKRQIHRINGVSYHDGCMRNRRRALKRDNPRHSVEGNALSILRRLFGRSA